MDARRLIRADSPSSMHLDLLKRCGTSKQFFTRRDLGAQANSVKFEVGKVRGCTHVWGFQRISSNRHSIACSKLSPMTLAVANVRLDHNLGNAICEMQNTPIAWA